MAPLLRVAGPRGWRGRKRLLLAAPLVSVLLAACTGETEDAISVGSENATLKAHGTANDGPAQSRFEYAVSRTELESPTGNKATTAIRPSATTYYPAGASGPISEAVDDLAWDTTYFYRICGKDQNDASWTCAGTKSFRTNNTTVGKVPFYRYASADLSDRLALSANVVTGNLVVTEDTLRIAGTAGFDLQLSNTYNSQAWYETVPSLRYAGGWRDVGALANDLRESPNSNGGLAIRDPSGFTPRFVPTGGGSFASPPGVRATLKKQGSGSTLRYRLAANDTGEAAVYTPTGQLDYYEDKNRNRISAAYQSGRLSALTDSQGRRVTYAVASDAGGDTFTLTDEAGSRTFRYRRDLEGRLLWSTDAAGKTTRYEYEPDGTVKLLTKIVTPAGRETRLDYNASGRVTSITRVTDAAASTGPTTSFTYNLGNTVVTDPRGNRTTYYYDESTTGQIGRHGPVLKVLDARGKTRTSTYSANQDLQQSTDATQNVSTLTYDGSDRLVESQQPAAAGQSAGLKATFGYGSDPASASFYDPTSSTDTQGNRVSYGYDASGNLSTITNQLSQGNVARFTRNANGTLATSTDPEGNVTRYSYDVKGNLTGIDNPAPLGDTAITYDALSRADVITNGSGRTTDHTYDALDRVTRLSYADGSSVAYTYDADGNVLTRVDSAGTSTYVYDALGRVTQETLPGNRVNKYTYDAAGNLTRLEDAGGLTDYTYGATNLLLSAKAPGEAAATTLAYDDNERRTSVAYPNGVTQSMSYDNPGRLLEIKATRGAATLTRFLYTYTRGTADTDLRQSVTDQAGRRTVYSYDVLNRLTRAEDVAGGSDVFQYTYDGNSNITSRTKNGLRVDYTLNAAKQLTRAGTTTFSYDGAGGLTGASTGLGLTYNAKDQTASVTPPGGSALAMSYAGRGQGERLAAGGLTFTPNRLGVGVERSGTSATYYTRETSGRLLSERLPSGARHYYLFDGIGSVVALTDGGGAVSQTYRYEPYGERIGTGNAVANPWRFAGAYQDPTNLYKVGARYYDPAVGRWTQPEPLNPTCGVGTAMGYEYAAGDPVNRTDASGLVDLDCVLSCAKGGAKCASKLRLCAELLGLPVGGTQAFLGCIAVACGPEAIRCIKDCLD